MKIIKRFLVLPLVLGVMLIYDVFISQKNPTQIEWRDYFVYSVIFIVIDIIFAMAKKPEKK